MGQTATPPAGTDGIAEAAAKAGRRGPPPVHLWNPPYCGEMDLEIRANGTWLHEGTPIGRPAMVRLFASVLKREGDRFYLVTPVEKLGIRVEDAPFLAIDADIAPDCITFTTNVGDVVTAGPDHPIRIEARDGAPRPYVHVRRGLDALIDRKTFYRLVEAAEEEHPAGTGGGAEAAMPSVPREGITGAVELVPADALTTKLLPADIQTAETPPIADRAEAGAPRPEASSDTSSASRPEAPATARPSPASPRLILRSNGAIFPLEP